MFPLNDCNGMDRVPYRAYDLWPSEVQVRCVQSYSK